MLDLDGQHPGKARARPLFVKIIRFLFLDLLIVGNPEPHTGIIRQVLIRRCSTPITKIGREMPVKDRQWIFDVGMLVESFRQQDVGADIHRPAPEFGQQLALDPNVFDIFRVFGIFDWRNDLIDRQGDLPGLRRVKMNFYRRRIDVAGRQVPVLSFPLSIGNFTVWPFFRWNVSYLCSSTCT